MTSYNHSKSNGSDAPCGTIARYLKIGRFWLNYLRHQIGLQSGLTMISSTKSFRVILTNPSNRSTASFLLRSRPFTPLSGQAIEKHNYLQAASLAACLQKSPTCPERPYEARPEPSGSLLSSRRTRMATLPTSQNFRGAIPRATPTKRF